MNNTNFLHSGIACVLIDKAKTETTDETALYIEGIDFEDEIFAIIEKIYYRFMDSAYTRIGNVEHKEKHIFYLHHKYWFIAVITAKLDIEKQMVKLYHLLPAMEMELDHSRNNLKQAKFIAKQFI